MVDVERHIATFMSNNKGNNLTCEQLFKVVSRILSTDCYTVGT